MVSGPLHDALRSFVEEAAFALARETEEGAEVPFEVVEEPGARGSVPLYCYRQLTSEFIRQRAGRLGSLATYAPAARALEALPGLASYLRLRGEHRISEEPRERAEAGLRCLLDAIFEGQGDFRLREERLEAAIAELDRAAREGRTLHTILAPVLGLELASERVDLGDGAALVRGDGLPGAPPEAVWSWGDGTAPAVLAELRIECGPEEGAPLSRARVRLRRLLTSLRLFMPGSFALGPAAWSRLDEGPWMLQPLAGTGRSHGPRTLLLEADEQGLRAFGELLARRGPRGGEAAWALARYEMGCERMAPFEALSDYLLALRALLEPEGPESGRLPQRLAAICALPEGRARLAERTAHAASLERAVIAGLAPPQAGSDALVSELAGHLRALLRDVICGHLDSDVAGVADDILADLGRAASVLRP